MFSLYNSSAHGNYQMGIQSVRHSNLQFLLEASGSINSRNLI